MGPSTSVLAGSSIAKELNDVRLACSEAMKNMRGSIQLPTDFCDRQEVEEYCIQKCQVVISTVCSALRLHKLRPDRIDLLIVDDASTIRESDLIVPLRLSVRHIWMLGDDKMHPLTNKVSENDGYSNSLFRRLSQLGFSVDRLFEQYQIDPAIFLFPNKYFYAGKIVDSQNVQSPHYSAQFKDLNRYQNYVFYDIGDSYNDESIDTIEETTILGILKYFCRGWQGVARKLDLAVVCLHSSRSDAIKARLIKSHTTQDRINLHVKCANSLQGERYDAIILTALSNDDKTLVRDQDIISALTKARHCLWTLFKSNEKQGGVFKELVDDAIDRKFLIQLDIFLFSIKDQSANKHNFANNTVSRKVTTERTWEGRPHKGKDILGDMRDQKSTDDCTLYSSVTVVQSLKKFQYAKLVPPKDFIWVLDADKLGVEFKKITKKVIGEEEDMAQRGCYRLETVQKILKDTGAIGHNPLEPKVEKTFKIKSYCKLDIQEKEGMDDAVLAIRDGKFLSGHFRISRNYFSLKPGEIYHYDKTKAYLTPSFSLPASHVVMMIGSGVTETFTELPSGDIRHEKKDVHLNFQNSAGKLFGDGGFGKIGSSSVRGLYQMEV